MKKKIGLLISIFLFSLPVALADLMSSLRNAGNGILFIGGLGWLGIGSDSVVVALLRLLIGVLVFTIFFSLINYLSSGNRGAAAGGGVLSFLNRSQAIVVAAIIAMITAIFLPGNVLMATGSGWAVIVALALIGGPIVGLGYVLWNLNDWLGQTEETRGTVLLKILLCAVLFWVLNAINYHIGQIRW